VSAKLELIRECKLYRLIPGMKKSNRLEASGVAIIDDRHALVVFDNRNDIAHIDASLEPSETNRLIHCESPGKGFEDIAIDLEGGKMFCLIEALKDEDGVFRGCVVEYDLSGKFIRCDHLSREFESESKGFEGLAFGKLDNDEYLFALCEGNLGTKAKRGGGHIEVFHREPNGSWDYSHNVRLPKSAEFDDYAAIAHRNGRLAVVSQESARVWTAQLDPTRRTLVPDSESVYQFPKKSYGNVEGIAWLSDDTLLAVSDKKKSDQHERCEKRDQSIHVFRIV
jgi:hypothetical protein